MKKKNAFLRLTDKGFEDLWCGSTRTICEEVVLLQEVSFWYCSWCVVFLSLFSFAL